MDTIQKLEQRADDMSAVVRAWEAEAMAEIGKEIRKISKKSKSEAEKYDAKKEAEKRWKEIVAALAVATALNIRSLKKTYTDAFDEWHEANRYLYDYRGVDFSTAAENKAIHRIINDYAKQNGKDILNLTNTKALSVVDPYGRVIRMQDAIYKAFGEAVGYVKEGKSDFYTSMRRTIETLGGGGCRVDYGGGITRRLDTVVRQNMLWHMKQSHREYNDMIGEELGCDGIEIDYHSNPRPTHEFMQGKQYAKGEAKTVNGVYYPSAEREGVYDRLYQDYNCLHYETDIILGVSVPRYSEEELKRLKEQDAKTYDIGGKQMTGYEASQAMRRLETEVRKQKDIRNMASAAGDNFLVRQCNERIKAYQGKYDEISEITGIAKENRRMSVQKPQIDLTNGTRRVNIGYKQFDINASDDYKKWEKTYYSKNLENLTEEDISSLNEYSDGNCAAINGVERFERGSEQYQSLCERYGVENLDEYKSTSDKISKSISKFNLEESILTHRHVPHVNYITGTTSSLDDLKNSIGHEYTEKGFFSTCLFDRQTKSYGGSDGVHLEVMIPKGSRGAYMNEFSEKKDVEYEFLLDKGTSFRIVDAGERTIIDHKYNNKTGFWETTTKNEKYMILEVLK